MAPAFRRHLQSRFSLNHNNQIIGCSENIKHVWYLPPSTGSWTVLWCVEDYRDCRYSPAPAANRGRLTPIVALIRITYHRRSYKIKSPNVSRNIKWRQILAELLKVVNQWLKSTRSYRIHIVSVTVLVWFYSVTVCESSTPYQTSDVRASH